MDVNRINNRTVLRILGVIAGFVGIILLAYVVRQQLAWIATAAFLALALNPAVSTLALVMPKRSRGLAILSVLLAVILLLLFMGITLLPPLFHQTKELATSLPLLLSKLRTGTSPLAEFVRQYSLVEQLQSQLHSTISGLGNVSGSVFSILGSVFGSFLAGLTILVLTYFMLIEGPDLIERAWAYHPNPSKERNQKLAVKMYGSVTGYVLGNVLTSVICFVATWLFLTIAGLPYALPIALLVGLLDLVPMVGASLGAILAILVALTQSFYLGLGTLVFFLVYQQVENNFLQPYVYGRTVQISPLAVFISALLGVALGGLLGALVAVPIGASIAIVLREVLPSRRVKK